MLYIRWRKLFLRHTRLVQPHLVQCVPDADTGADEGVRLKKGRGLIGAASSLGRGAEHILQGLLSCPTHAQHMSLSIVCLHAPYATPAIACCCACSTRPLTIQQTLRQVYAKIDDTQKTILSLYLPPGATGAVPMVSASTNPDLHTVIKSRLIRHMRSLYICIRTAALPAVILGVLGHCGSVRTL